jgi:hypothetical protein
MSHRKSYNRYHGDGGFDSTGRWRSEAWHMDGGANDEGWHYRFCSYCSAKTEHGRGSGCVECENRMTAAADSRRKASSNPAKEDRSFVLNAYTKSAPLPSFLQSLKEQNEKRALTPKQVAVGAKILSKHIDSGTLKTFWSGERWKR